MDPAFSNYPSNMNTWMVYGPFDLSNAKSASVSFRLWRETEAVHDQLFFGVSEDGSLFGGLGWDGSAGWENETLSLDGYVGDSDVWIAWYFFSNDSVEYEGPWIDDIVLDFVPRDITVHGNFAYADRNNVMLGSESVEIQLWDRDADGNNDLLDTTYAEENGDFDFIIRTNWDMDDTDPILSNRRLDLYVLYIVNNENYIVTDLDGNPYTWASSTRNNVNVDNLNIVNNLPSEWVNLPAMWIFQDMRRTREFLLRNTYPPIDPDYLAAHWKKDQNSEYLISGSFFWALNNPHVFIQHNSILSSDTVVHELGHQIIWNHTGQWLWYDFGCYQHEIFSQESVQCAWSEGWSDYFAIVVNDNVCYDFDQFACSGYDLENHTRNDPNNTGSWWGDNVEGRVAGTLYDLMDSANESPWYDNASWGFDSIVDITFEGSGHSSLQQFWTANQGIDKHNGVRSIYQNTIDYDQDPMFSTIPDQSILQNFPHVHVFDLWNYSNDVESPDALLIYSIVSVSDPRCGIDLDSHWINANPQLNWIGSCYVTVRVNDTIKTNTGGFWMHILQINSRIFLPIIMTD